MSTNSTTNLCVPHPIRFFSEGLSCGINGSNRFWDFTILIERYCNFSGYNDSLIHVLIITYTSDFGVSLSIFLYVSHFSFEKHLFSFQHNTFKIWTTRSLSLFSKFITKNRIAIAHPAVSMSLAKIMPKLHFSLPSPNFPSTAFCAPASYLTIFVSDSAALCPLVPELISVRSGVSYFFAIIQIGAFKINLIRQGCLRIIYTAFFAVFCRLD
jgi:hypothetical protein